VRRGACKPGSVTPTVSLRTRWRWQPFIAARLQRPTRAIRRETRLSQPCLSTWLKPAAPIRSCSGWGLPCRDCYQPRGALLPHPFTLACESKLHRRSALCGTFPRLASGGHYPPPLFRGARTFLGLHPAHDELDERRGCPAPRRARCIAWHHWQTRILSIFSLITVQQQREQNRGTLAIDHTVNRLRPPAPLEGAHCR
jgi:hypothetical protein